jgi:hypothetical protein
MGDQSAEDPKLINDPKNVVREMLEGLVAEHGHLSLLDGFDKVSRCLACLSCKLPFQYDNLFCSIDAPLPQNFRLSGHLEGYHSPEIWCTISALSSL